MKSVSATCIASLLVVLLASAPTVLAEWSVDAAANLAIGDRTGEQVQPKVRPTADGGCYISWFDNSSGGYDVYLQRLDPSGDEQWAHNGVLLADRSFSSTEDYGLDVDTAGNAVLAFRDDRGGATVITAVMVAPNGTMVWGANGVQLTSGEAVFSPRIAATSDGYVVVGWTQDSTTRLQKLDATGTPLWGTGVVLSDTAGANFAISDLHGSDAGSVIVSWVRWGPMFWDPKHLWAQKVSSTGTLLWNSPGSHVIVFDGDSLQFGNFPPFVTDGSGGAVFAWYGVSPLQCYTQHVLADGTEAFGHNGVSVSTNTSRLRVSPSASFNPATGETFVFWVEENSTQSQHGVYGQKLAADGTRQWTNNGKVVVPVGTNERSFVNTLVCGDGAMVFYLDAPSFGNDVIYGARLDTSGDFVWPGDLVLAASLPNDKSRLSATLSAGGDALLTWTDDRSDSGDVFAQNVDPDGTLGGCSGPAADLDCDGDVDLDDFAVLADCLGGPEAGLFPDCEAPDLDGESDVDLSDFAAFSQAFTG